MLQQQNILLRPIQVYEVSDEQHQRIEYIIQNARAIQFRIEKLMKRCFRAMDPQYWHHYYLLRRYFNMFIMGLLSQKEQKVKLYLKKNCLDKLKNYRDKKLKQKKRVQQYLKKITRGKLRLMLKEWKNVSRIQMLTKGVQKNRYTLCGRELIELLSQNNSLMKRKKLEVASEIINLQDVYCQKIVKKAFQNLKINTKMEQVRRKIRSKNFKELIFYMQRLNEEDRTKGYRFFSKNTLAKCFLSWKEQYHSQIAARFYTQRLLAVYFDLWKQHIPYLQSEREIQSNNEVIVKIYQEKRLLKMRDEMFKRWRQLTVYQKQVSHHNQILNKFAQKQCRYLLLHKHFQKLKLNCLNNKVKLKYYQTKLKRKVVDAFKIYFSKSIEKEGKILDYMDKSYLRRCFNKIKQFNKQQQYKVTAFRLKKALFDFMASVIGEYCRKVDLANNFNRMNLLYKTLFSLKKIKLQRKQQNYVIVLVNIILPLRRWQKRFRFQRYLTEKEWFLKKSIMREWRMRVVRKDSEKKLVREFKEIESARKTLNSEQKLQMFEFQNIMATIAQIRNNINSEKQQKQQGEKELSYSLLKARGKEYEVHTPSQSINFSYSLEQYE